jgi:hypothetical protein
MGSAVEPKSSNLARFTFTEGSSLENARFSALRMNFCGENWPCERVRANKLLRASTAHDLGGDATAGGDGLWDADDRSAVNDSDQLSCQEVSP